MFKHVVTCLAAALTFSSNSPPFQPTQHFKAGVNGVFYCTKTGRLASLVWWEGKELGRLPVKRRGGLVCTKEGTVLAGYFEVVGGRIHFNNQPLSPKDCLWALAGGGLYLLDHHTFSAKEVSKKEHLSLYIVTHASYSFILVHKDRKTVTLGVSKNGIPPAELARRCRGRYYALLRLDGGSATRYFFSSPKPSGVNNAVGLKQ